MTASTWINQRATVDDDGAGNILLARNTLGYQTDGIYTHHVIAHNSSTAVGVEVIGPDGSWKTHPTFTSTYGANDAPIVICDGPWQAIRLTNASASSKAFVSSRNPGFGRPC